MKKILLVTISSVIIVAAIAGGFLVWRDKQSKIVPNQEQQLSQQSDQPNNTQAEIDARPEIAKVVIDENLEMLEMKNVSLTLEQVFIKLTMH